MAFEPDWVSMPGSTIMDYIEEKGWTVPWLAEQLGVDVNHFVKVLMADEPIGINIAEALFKFTGMKPEFWLKRQMNYELGLQRQENMFIDARRYRKLKKLPIHEVSKLPLFNLYGDSGNNELDKALDALDIYE